MIRFVFQSFVFKRLLVATVILIVLLVIGNRIFDMFWDRSNCITLTNMDDVYFSPVEYDKEMRIYMAFVDHDRIVIEGNRKFRISGSKKNFDYFDTAKVLFPKDTYFAENRIYLQFEASKHTDSVYFVISKSGENNIYFNQIFLSSVKVKGINEFSKNKELFRGDPGKLVNPGLLENNDTLINLAVNYFNMNSDTLKIGDCGRNSMTFMDICRIYQLPCRLIYLQGGDFDISGYKDKIGYPSHMVCEVYSSRLSNWYVIDPTYGIRFRDKGTDNYLSAAEISNNFFFNKENQMVQDSIFFTNRSLLGRDYFEYYENVHYECNFNLNYVTTKILQNFYPDFNYYYYLYSNKTPFFKNGKNYLIFKSLVYLVLIALHLNYAVFVLIMRLMKIKMPQKIQKS